MDTTYIVAKPFNTRSRRFKVGDEITAADIDHDAPAPDWAREGFLTIKGAKPIVVLPKPSAASGT